MNNTDKDYLTELFHEMRQENPSEDFMKKVMICIEKKVVKQQRRDLIYGYLYMTAGTIGIICIPALILHFFQIDISFNINFASMFQRVVIEPFHLLFALIILGLLIGDTLLRKRLGVFGKEC